MAFVREEQTYNLIPAVSTNKQTRKQLQLIRTNEMTLVGFNARFVIHDLLDITTKYGFSVIECLFGFQTSV